MVADPDIADFQAAGALSALIAGAVPYLPAIVRVRDDAAPALPDALPVAEDAPVERLIARVVSAQRLRTLHATVLGRAQALRTNATSWPNCRRATRSTTRPCCWSGAGVIMRR